MKEYKVEVISGMYKDEQATDLMNQYAAYGWTVKSTCATSDPYRLYITFERDIHVTYNRRT